MRRANVVSGVVLALFSLAMVFAVIPAQIEPAPEGFVSPRLVPTLMMLAVAGLSMLLVAANLRPDPAADDTPPVSRAELLALLKIAALFAVALGLYAALGPLAAGIALTAGGLLVLGERRPLVVVALPAVLLTGLWLLFYKLLGTAIL